MILRKPYGFLIKHFRLIHIILTFIYIYLAIKVNSVLKYYNNYILGTENRLNAIKYVTNYYMIAIIISIIICLVIYALMRYKKKPKLLYLILIALYIVVAIIINISYDGLNTLYISYLDAKTLRLYRDFLKIIIIFQYISIAFTTIRGLGFDIKKFNFKEDINELDLDINDDEEVELTIGGAEAIERKGRKKLRELMYYYKENKMFIIVIIAILLFIGLSSITINTQFINKVYKENETVSTDSFNLKVLNTYTTNKSYKNQTISYDTSYVIVRMLISPKIATKMNISNLILKINNNNYTVNEKNYGTFLDLGYNYSNTVLRETKTYIFIFNIDKKDANSKMQLRYAEDKKINLNPIYLDEVTTTKKLKLTESMDLSTSSLGSGNITINSYEIKNMFEYGYNYEINGKIYTSKLNIQSLSNKIINLKISSSLPYKMDLYDFISNYGKLKYKINDEEYESSILNNKTPGSYKEGLYLEVDKKIENASNIWLELIIRNTKYEYTIK